jgi:hypothetical protein
MSGDVNEGVEMIKITFFEIKPIFSKSHYYHLTLYMEYFVVGGTNNGKSINVTHQN